MRKVLILLTVVLLCTAVGYAQTKRNFANGPHKITITGGSGSCASCHLPHNAGASAKILLWAPALPAGPYATYAASGGIADGSNLVKPTTANGASHSFLCLSCHDGAAADTNFDTGGRFAGATFTGTLSDGSTVPAKPNSTNLTLMTGAGSGNGTGVEDLSDDHPVGFPYPATGTEPASLEDIANITGSTSSTVAPILIPFFGTGGDEVQCASCHDPHDQNLTGAKFYLRGADVETLCTTCHL